MKVGTDLVVLGVVLVVLGGGSTIKVGTDLVVLGVVFVGHEMVVGFGGGSVMSDGVEVEVRVGFVPRSAISTLARCSTTSYQDRWKNSLLEVDDVFVNLTVGMESEILEVIFVGSGFFDVVGRMIVGSTKPVVLTPLVGVWRLIKPSASMPGTGIAAPWQNGNSTKTRRGVVNMIVVLPVMFF